MTKTRTEPMSRHRLDEIGWTEWTEKTPAETGAIVLELINEVKRQRTAAAAGAPATGTVAVEMTREDAQELQLILTGDRYHMDRGDGDVPQPRWGANVRVSGAVDRALGLLPQES